MIKSKSKLVNFLLIFRPYIVKIWCLFPTPVSKFHFGLFKNSNFKVGFIVRYLCLYKLSKSCGEKVIVFPNVSLFNLENLEIGTNVSIHENSYIDCYGGLKIGDSVAISHNCSILTFDHNINQFASAIKDSGTFSKPVCIGSDVWLGAGSRILKGVNISDGSVIAAGAVLTSSTNENGIYAGVPARLIRYRKSN
jgi:acetyltransferase-like isoleucine patch superfamily enzyme